MVTIETERTDIMNEKRMKGTVLATFPDRGFFWITGSDGVKYFGHQTKVRNGYMIYDMWEGQELTFLPKHDDKRGPRGEDIEVAVRQHA